MGNLPDKKPKEHDDSKASVNLNKQNHPVKTRPIEKGAPPSGG